MMNSLHSTEDEFLTTLTETIEQNLMSVIVARKKSFIDTEQILKQVVLQV